MRKGWESWGCAAGQEEGSRENSERLPMPEGAARELERDFFQGHGVIRQGVTALN